MADQTPENASGDPRLNATLTRLEERVAAPSGGPDGRCDGSWPLRARSRRLGALTAVVTAPGRSYGPFSPSWRPWRPLTPPSVGQGEKKTAATR